MIRLLVFYRSYSLLVLQYKFIWLCIYVHAHMHILYTHICMHMHACVCIFVWVYMFKFCMIFENKIKWTKWKWMIRLFAHFGANKSFSGKSTCHFFLFLDFYRYAKFQKNKFEQISSKTGFRQKGVSTDSEAWIHRTSSVRDPKMLNSKRPGFFKIKFPTARLFGNSKNFFLYVG